MSVCRKEAVLAWADRNESSKDALSDSMPPSAQTLPPMHKRFSGFRGWHRRAAALSSTQLGSIMPSMNQAALLWLCNHTQLPCRLAHLNEQLLEIANELIESAPQPDREQHLRAKRQELIAAKQALEQAPGLSQHPMHSMHSSSGPFGQGPMGAMQSQLQHGPPGMMGSGFLAGSSAPYGQLGAGLSSLPGSSSLGSSFGGEGRGPPAPLDRNVSGPQQDCR